MVPVKLPICSHTPSDEYVWDTVHPATYGVTAVVWLERGASGITTMTRMIAARIRPGTLSSHGCALLVSRPRRWLVALDMVVAGAEMYHQAASWILFRTSHLRKMFLRCVLTVSRLTKRKL